MASPVRHSRCMCGTVELEIRGEPTAQAYCHCESCRGWTAAPLWAATMWAASSISERVLAVADGLPKFRDYPREFGGSGVRVPEG